jgi:dihydropteroate synthase
MPEPIVVRGLELRPGRRTYVMGIVNVTPDSFSGDGLLSDDASDHPDAVVEAALSQVARMVAEGADIIDIGGESTRPGFATVDVEQERARVIGVVAAARARHPLLPLSIDTSKPGVAEAALLAGADILNDVSAVQTGAVLAPIAAAYRAPYIVMHGRFVPPEDDVTSAVMTGLDEAMELAVAAGCARDTLIVDPGIGFGKTATQNLDLLRDLRALGELGRPVLLGASRKSTIGKVLDLPPDQRLEGTLVTTALGVAAGVDIVRVHDVAANVRAARMADAIIRGGWSEPPS